MEPQKDSQRTDGVVKFLDYQTLKSSPFGDNRVGERVYRRAERLASAIVLLTNHLNDSNPLKNEARKSALEILSNVLNVRDEMRSSNSSEVNDLKSSVRKLISIVRLLGVGGSISFQNAEIVTEALDELLSFLNASRRSNLSDSVSFSREDLIDVREAQRFVEEKRAERIVRPVSETQNSPQSGFSEARSGESSLSSQTSTRSLAILEVLKAHGELGIRDVAANLPEYSEKMIQRELVELVIAGKVKKTGLKRWSKYAYNI